MPVEILAGLIAEIKSQLRVHEQAISPTKNVNPLTGIGLQLDKQPAAKGHGH
jgi:hypothetical protein